MQLANTRRATQIVCTAEQMNHSVQVECCLHENAGRGPAFPK